ncbi:MAG TPA: hypothetical protein VF576_03290, partial [Rubricoccaceae bacterium]
MRPLALLALVSFATGCAVPSTASRDLVRAQEAADAGHARTALHLYRAAARGGSLEAQMHLVGEGQRGAQTWSERLFSPRPDRAESARWSRAAWATASRLAAAGRPEGHLALASFAYFGPDLSRYSSERDPQGDAVARRHLHAALDAGSAEAALRLGQLAWFGESPLTAVPHYRRAARMGAAEAHTALAAL